MNCTKCNAQIPDDSTFCPECGSKVEVVAEAPSTPAKVFCPECGSAMAPSDAFCENCGAKVTPAVPQAPKAGNKKLDLSKISKKTKVIGLAAVAALLVIVIVVCIIASAGNVNNYALYIKDGEMYYSDMPKGTAMEITSNLVDGGISNYYLTNLADDLAYEVTLSEDGKKLFFADKATVSSYGYLDTYTLYCRDVTKDKGEATKIDSGVSSYLINEKGTLVTYKKDGNLYQHNLKEKTKVASDVSSYRISADGKTILYLVKESDESSGNLYLKKSNKEAEKIASDVTSITYLSDNAKTILYRKDDSLYSKSGSKDAVKIAGDVYSVYTVYEDGSFYYVTTEEETIKCWDLISDDLQSNSDYDYLRQQIKDCTMDNPVATLNYYDGKNSTKLTEGYTFDYEYATENPVILYSALSGELPTIKLSKLVTEYGDYYFDNWYLESMITEAMEDDTAYYVACESKISTLELDDIYYPMINAEGDTIYVLTNLDEDDNTSTLYKATISGKKIKKTEKIDEDVQGGAFIHNDAYIYLKDVSYETYEAELYLNGNKVDDDVYISDLDKLVYDENNKALYYFIDWNEEKEQGTLKQYKGKKATSIKDDVHSFCVTPEGEVLFLYDYSLNNYKGELWILNGKKTTKLDDDVVAIIPVY